MLLSKSMKFLVLAVTTFASLSLAKPISKLSVELSTREHGAPKLHHRGLFNLPIGTPSPAPSPGTAPGVLVNLDTKLGNLMTGDLNGTAPGNDGSLVGVTTDIENLKHLIENVQSLLANATTSLSGATGGGPISLQDSGAVTNIVKTVVGLIVSVAGATKGVAAREVPLVGGLPIIAALPLPINIPINVPTDKLPVIGSLLGGLTKTLADFLFAVLVHHGEAPSNGRSANVDVLKTLLAPLVGVAATALRGVGVDASALTGVVGI